MLLMVFTINEIKFGIPLEQVEYIAEELGHIQTTTAFGHIRGTTILRDEVVTVYDLASRFAYNISKESTVFIVVSKNKRKFALAVEKIAGIKYWEEYICEEIPSIAQSEHVCIKQVVSFREEIILVLDLDKIDKEI